MERHRKTGTPGNVERKRVRRPCLSVFDTVKVSLLCVCVLYFGWSIGQRVSLNGIFTVARMDLCGSCHFAVITTIALWFVNYKPHVCASQFVSQITNCHNCCRIDILLPCSTSCYLFPSPEHRQRHPEPP